MTQIPTWSGGSATPTTGRAAPGTIIGGRYTLRAAVGHGGMGTVWRAADTLLRRDVAVKEVLLPPGLAPSDRDAMYERTLREARAAAALQHPAVVQVYDVVHEGGRPWIVMELLDARSLADMVIEDGPLAARAVAKIGIALLGALEVAHASGVLHRDVKPANVLICADGRCVLTDFGVARMPTEVQLTTPGMVLGSPHFISPERAMGSDFGPPSDLFSLGVTLYTAVEGRPPFDKGDPIETMHAVVEDPPAPTVRAGELTNVLMGLLEKDPAHRYDVHTSRTMLRQLLSGPLASKAPGHLMTDPYAVVPAQRPPASATAPQPSAPPTPGGQIGGRAMLAPNESLTDRLAKLRRAGRGAAAPAKAVDVPTGPHPAPAATPGPATDATQAIRSGAAGSETTSVIPPREQWQQAAAQPKQQWPVPAPDVQRSGTVVAASGARRRAVVEQAVAAARQGGGRLVETVRAWPRNAQLAAGAGLGVLVLVCAVLIVSGGSDDPQPVAQPQTSAPAPEPALPTQEYTGRGVSVDVPKSWKRSTGGVYTDFTDRDDPGRRVRILVEDSRAEATAFMEAAEERLSKNTKSCAKPYNRVAFREVEVAGRPAAELEYTCGAPGEQRHGIWRVFMQGRKAYGFYLSTPEERFADSKPIFDTMVKSFTVTSAG